MSFTLKGVRLMGGDRDDDGYMTYNVEFVMFSNTPQGFTDGPAAALQCPQLPQTYSLYDPPSWNLGTDVGKFNNIEQDPYSWCHWDAKVKPMYKPEEPGVWYTVELRFSSKPDKRCRTNPVEDPINEPPVISGSTSKYTEQGLIDRFGNFITNSAWERIQGPQNEWDHNRKSIKIQQNVASSLLGYILPSQMLDCVNGLPLWGFPPRTIKLSSCPWELKFNGPCSPYYQRTLEFDIRYQQNDDGSFDTWDRNVLDEGTKVLAGQWKGQPGVGNGLQWVPTVGANPQNPTHFIKAVDFQTNNPIKLILNGRGVPAGLVTPLQTLFMAILPNINVPLTDGSTWVPIINDPTAIPAWTAPDQDLGQFYKRGTLVTFGGNNYIAVGENDSQVPPPANVFDWTFMSATITSRGIWSAATNYIVGDYVNGVGNSGLAGNVNIQYYPSVDFSQLGIPLSF